MRRITIKRARTWHCGKMRRYIAPSNDLAPLSPFRSWLDCTTNTSGYDFGKDSHFCKREADKQATPMASVLTVNAHCYYKSIKGNYN
jgi:hypothetical protein